MFRRSAALYRDQPYEQDTEFYQDNYFSDWARPSGDDIVKGALAGAAAGIAAGFVMVQFQKLWTQWQPELNPRQEREETPKHRQAAQQEDGKQHSEDATVKLADRVSRSVLKHELSEGEKKIAGPAVHYGFAATAGAMYGALAETNRLSTAGFGTLFASALFIAADEVAVPAMRLSPPPQRVSMDKHLFGVVSHLVYGVVLEAGRRALRRTR